MLCLGKTERLVACLVATVEQELTGNRNMGIVTTVTTVWTTKRIENDCLELETDEMTTV